jgi:acetyl-CoA carboxylase biotin carboxylase subunit
MLGKLIVWGADREQAVTRMRRALVDLTILGVETSRDFHVRMMDDAEFRRGDIDIQWLERRLGSILERRPPGEAVRVAAIAGALLGERERVTRTASGAAGGVGAGGVARSSGLAADAWKQAARLEGLRD